GHNGGGAPDGHLTSQTDAFNRTTTFDLDGAKLQVLSTVGGLVETNTINHTDSGAIASVADASNHTASVAYDSRGRLIASTDALGKSKTLSYNSQNLPVSQS